LHGEPGAARARWAHWRHQLGFIWEPETFREFVRVNGIYGAVAVASLALFKVGHFVTTGIGRIFGLENPDSADWGANPMAVMVIAYGLLAVLRLKAPRSFWVIGVAVLGNIGFWAFISSVGDHRLGLGVVLASVVGGLFALGILVIIEPLLPASGVRVEPNYPD
jgi:hypothetical protein